MSQLNLEPLFLLDDNLSYRFAPALLATGYDVRSVRSEWPSRDPFTNPVEDEEIIQYLGEIGRHRAIWVTAEEKPLKVHATVLLAEKISVLQISETSSTPLTGLNQLRLLASVIANSYRSVAQARSPVYMKASYNGRRPRFEILQGSLHDTKLVWKRSPLTQ